LSGSPFSPKYSVKQSTKQIMQVDVELYMGAITSYIFLYYSINKPTKKPDIIV